MNSFVIGALILFLIVIIIRRDKDKCDWMLYVSDTCKFCKQQLDIVNMLYPKFSNIIRNDPAVNAVPTWINKHTGKHIIGLQLEESLKNMLNKC